MKIKPSPGRLDLPDTRQLETHRAGAISEVEREEFGRLRVVRARALIADAGYPPPDLLAEVACRLLPNVHNS